MEKRVVYNVILLVLVAALVFVIVEFSNYRAIEEKTTIPVVTDIVQFQPAGILFGNQTQGNGTTVVDSIFVDLDTTTVTGKHYSLVDFNKDLLLWMRMDDRNVSGDFIDLSSHGHHGVAQGGLIINSSGYWGDGSHFDGINDFIRFSNSSLNGQFNDLTISVWVKPVLSGSTEFILGDFLFLSSKGIMLEIQGSTNEFRFLMSTTIPGFFGINSDSAASSGVWQHIVVSKSSTELKMYVDGVLQSGIITGNFSSIDDSPEPFSIGCLGPLISPCANLFDGAIDEVMIFNRSLNELEVAALYNSNTLLNFISIKNDLKTWINVDDNNGITVFDQSPSGYNTTLTNGASIFAEGGSFGDVLNFDGVDDFVNIETGFGPTGSFTMGAWIKSKGADISTRGFIGSDPGTSALPRAPSISVYGTNSILYGFSDGSGWQATGAPNKIEVGNWSHVVFRLDTVANIRELFVDGISVSSAADTRNPIGVPIDLIGRARSTIGNSFFNGSVDDVFVLNRSLSNTEIFDLYNSTKAYYRRGFSGLSNGRYDIIGYAADKISSKYETELRTVIVDSSFDITNICGNGLIGLGEQCDDNNIISGDGCSSLCQMESGFTCVGEPSVCTSTQVCGDGVIEGNETCDDGAMNGQPNKCNSTCDGDTLPICGNSVIESGETCDDGNLISGDGCSAICVLESPENFSRSVQVLSPSDGNVFTIDEEFLNVSFTFNTINFTVGGKGQDHIHFRMNNVSGYEFTDVFMFYNSPDSVVEFGLTPGITNFATRIDSDTVRFNNVGIGLHNFTAFLVNSAHIPLGNVESDVDITFSIVKDAVCGNGMTEVGEQCDDGNTINGDGCSSSCSTEQSSSGGDDDDGSGSGGSGGSGSVGGGGGGTPIVGEKPSEDDADSEVGGDEERANTTGSEESGLEKEGSLVYIFWILISFLIVGIIMVLFMIVRAGRKNRRISNLPEKDPRISYLSKKNV